MTDHHPDLPVNMADHLKELPVSVNDPRKDLPIEDYSGSTCGLKLDLYNFENVFAEESPYVLTSPRSLEACAQLDIKPVELLEKPLYEFEEECLLNGQPISYANHMYEAHESNRLETLRFCRQIRKRIVLKEGEASVSEESEVAVDKHAVTSTPKMSELSLSSSLKHSPRQAVVEIGQGDYNEDGCHQNFHMRTLPSENPKDTKDHEKREKTTPSSVYKKKKNEKQQRLSSTCGSYQDSSILSLASTGSYKSGKNASRVASLDMLPNRDKRILDLLETKHLLHQAEEQVKHTTRLAWEDEKKENQAAKMEVEKRQRQSLKQEWKHKHRLNEELSNIELGYHQVLYNEEKHRRLIETQNKIRALQIHQKKMKEIEKKRRQEKSLEEREKNEEEFRQIVNDELAGSLDRAVGIKQRKVQHEIQERRRRNAIERARHEYLRELASQQSQEDTEYLQHSIHLQHNRAERSLQDQQRHRNQQLQYLREREIGKQLTSQKTKQDIDLELEEWRHRLTIHGTESHHRAVERASQMSVLKANKASHLRRSRERIHRELMSKVKEDEEAEKTYIKKKIAYKDHKTRTHSTEKEKAIQRSRDIARISADLRENIRKTYLGTFDKMVERAELESRIGTGPRGAAKNFSTVGLF